MKNVKLIISVGLSTLLAAPAAATDQTTQLKKQIKDAALEVLGEVSPHIHIPSRNASLDPFQELLIEARTARADKERIANNITKDKGWNCLTAKEFANSELRVVKELHQTQAGQESLQILQDYGTHICTASSSVFQDKYGSDVGGGYNHITNTITMPEGSVARVIVHEADHVRVGHLNGTRTFIYFMQRKLGVAIQDVAIREASANGAEYVLLHDMIEKSKDPAMTMLALFKAGKFDPHYVKTFQKLEEKGATRQEIKDEIATAFLRGLDAEWYRLRYGSWFFQSPLEKDGRQKPELSTKDYSQAKVTRILTKGTSLAEQPCVQTSAAIEETRSLDETAARAAYQYHLRRMPQRIMGINQ